MTLTINIVVPNPRRIEEILKYAKPIGYNVTLVWVCCNMETAREGNQNRDRHVSDEVIVKGHKGAYKTMMALFDNKYPEVTKDIDNAWIAFSAGYGRMLKKELENDPVIKIKKDEEGKFNFDKKEMVETFLKEQQPEDPKFKKKVEANESLNESINSLDILIEQIKNEILI